MLFPDIDPIAFAIGPFAIRWYALGYLFGVGLGWRAIDEAGNGGGAGGGAASTATIHLTEFALDPSSVTIASGGTLAVHNDGSVPHDLAIEGTDFRTPLVNAGETFNLSLTGLAPGRSYTLRLRAGTLAQPSASALTVAMFTADAHGHAAATGHRDWHILPKDCRCSDCSAADVDHVNVEAMLFIEASFFSNVPDRIGGADGSVGGLKSLLSGGIVGHTD